MLSQTLHDICHATDEQQIRQILKGLKPSAKRVIDNKENKLPAMPKKQSNTEYNYNGAVA